MAYRRFGLTWFARSAANRLRRKNWNRPTRIGQQDIPTGDCNQLADELWSQIIRLRDADAPTGEVTGPGGNFTIDDVVQRVLDEIDLDFPTEPPTPEPHQHEGPEFVETITPRTIWVRSCLPGKITSHVSGSDYNVDVYPYGKLDILNADETVKTPGPVTENVVVEQLQINSGETQPDDTWVLVARILQYRVDEVVTTLKETGQVIGHRQLITELQRGHYMQAPVWL